MQSKKFKKQFTINSPPVHTPLYAFLPSKKSFNHSYADCFLLISNGKAYEALPFQTFTPRVHVSIVYFLIMRRFSCVKVCSLRPSRAFTARVNALKTNPSHQKHWKSGGNTLCVKEVNAFSGNLIRIYAHVKGRFKTDGGIFSVTEPPRLSCPTSRDVLFTTPGLVRTSPGVGKTSPGLVTHKSPTCCAPPFPFPHLL